MYKKLLFSLLLSFLLCGCAAPSASETTAETAPAGAVEIGTSSYYCITGESEEQEVSSGSRPVKVKAFSHKIYNPNNKYVVTLTTTIAGAYSSQENTAEINHVSGTLSDAQAEGFTVSEHLAGDTATIIVYLNQISVCHFQYRLSPDGTMEFL